MHTFKKILLYYISVLSLKWSIILALSPYVPSLVFSFFHSPLDFTIPTPLSILNYLLYLPLLIRTLTLYLSYEVDITHIWIPETVTCFKNLDHIYACKIKYKFYFPND